MLGIFNVSYAFEAAVGARAGTLGLGAELTIPLISRINARLGINSYSYDYTTSESGIDYDGELDLSTTSLILDWHPFNGRFRISAGYVNNNNEISLKATPTTSQVIGDNPIPYTPAQIGTLTADVGFKKNVPYVGIGWGNAVSKNKRIGLNFDIGVLLQDSPEVTLNASSGAVNLLDLAAEEAQLESDISEFDAYPVISFGISFRF
ncbi:MAG: hypothetical protein BMS9Abin33_1232 [Gammaproteobacteria bacterium]|nr:MAG: hypothetical protein BMS9Abin33_1232 [Gammaproteobacteria bacterium]